VRGGKAADLPKILPAVLVKIVLSGRGRRGRAVPGNRERDRSPPEAAAREQVGRGSNQAPRLVRAFRGDRCHGLQPAHPGTAEVAAYAIGADCRSRPSTLFRALANGCGRATLARVLFSARSGYAHKRQNPPLKSTTTTTRPTRHLPRAGTTHGSEPRRSSPRLGSPLPRRAVARKVRAPLRASVPVRRCRP
jgi:hypothetical protein